MAPSIRVGGFGLLGTPTVGAPQCQAQVVEPRENWSRTNFWDGLVPGHSPTLGDRPKHRVADGTGGWKKAAGGPSRLWGRRRRPRTKTCSSARSRPPDTSPGRDDRGKRLQVRREAARAVGTRPPISSKRGQMTREHGTRCGELVTAR